MASALRQKRREEEEITRVRAGKTKPLAEIVPYKTQAQRKFEKIEAEAKGLGRKDIHTATPVKIELADSEKGLAGLLGQGTVGAADALFSLINRAKKIEREGLGDAGQS
jgi:hypothetical protein